MAYSNYFNHLHPVRLIIGHDYEIRYKGGEIRRYKLIKTSAKGYKFYNEKNFQCRPRFVLFPMKNKDGSKKETWFLLPDCMEFTDVTSNSVESVINDKLKSLRSDYKEDTYGGGSGRILGSVISHIVEIAEKLGINTEPNV